MVEKIAFLILVGLVFFCKSLSYKYVSDDITVLKRTDELKPKGWRKWLWFFNGHIRTNPQLDHVLTSIIHILIAVLIYLTFGATTFSYMAAFLFMFNPITNQCSVWISGRGYALPLLFFLLTMNWPVAGILFVPLMMHFPLGFVTAPLLIAAFPAVGLEMTALVLLGALLNRKVFSKRISDKTRMETFTDDKSIKFSKLIVIIKTLGFYTFHALIPIKTTFYHSFLQSMAGSGNKKAYTPERFFAFGCLCLSAAGWYIFTHGWNLASFLIVWWIIGLGPFLNAYRMSQEIAERYTYFPLPALMLILSMALYPYPYAYFFILGVYVCKLWFFMDAYQDEFYLMEYSCLNSPDSWFAWHVRGLKRWSVRSYRESIILWTMARMISPREFKVLFNLSVAFKLLSEHKQAKKFLDEAMNNIPPGQEEEAKTFLKQWKSGNYPLIV